MSITENPTTRPATDPTEATGMDRRTFLTRTTLGVGGALVMGIELAGGDIADAAGATGGSMGVYVTIGADESVTLTCPGAEMGQGISTAMPMILAEELMIDWSKVQVVLAGAGDAYCRPTSKTAVGTSQSSGGSNSIRGYHDYLRHLGAKIRLQMLTAATTYNSAAYSLSDLKVVAGVVRRVADDAAVATYGELATAAAAVSIADSDANIVWVTPANYSIIGTRKQRLDLPAKVNGSAVFGLDVRLPGMKYAAVRLAPKIGQT
ncbi:MAG: molybdopterin cofactor-binding domain-containing protein, partial [Ilumatobacteraceae bacterium]